MQEPGPGTEEEGTGAGVVYNVGPGQSPVQWDLSL